MAAWPNILQYISLKGQSLDWQVFDWASTDSGHLRLSHGWTCWCVQCMCPVQSFKGWPAFQEMARGDRAFRLATTNYQAEEPDELFRTCSTALIQRLKKPLLHQPLAKKKQKTRVMCFSGHAASGHEQQPRVKNLRYHRG